MKFAVKPIIRADAAPADPLPLRETIVSFISGGLSRLLIGRSFDYSTLKRRREELQFEDGRDA